jgi:hypothetical protein
VRGVLLFLIVDWLIDSFRILRHLDPRVKPEDDGGKGPGSTSRMTYFNCSCSE